MCTLDPDEQLAVIMAYDSVVSLHGVCDICSIELLQAVLQHCCIFIPQFAVLEKLYARFSGPDGKLRIGELLALVDYIKLDVSNPSPPSEGTLLGDSCVESESTEKRDLMSSIIDNSGFSSDLDVPPTCFSCACDSFTSAIYQRASTRQSGTVMMMHTYSMRKKKAPLPSLYKSRALPVISSGAKVVLTDALAAQKTASPCQMPWSSRQLMPRYFRWTSSCTRGEPLSCCQKRHRYFCNSYRPSSSSLRGVFVPRCLAQCF